MLYILQVADLVTGTVGPYLVEREPAPINLDAVG